MLTLLLKQLNIHEISLQVVIHNITAWPPNSIHLLWTFFSFLYMFWLWSIVFLYVTQIKSENYWDKCNIPKFSSKEEYIQKTFYMQESINVLTVKRKKKSPKFTGFYRYFLLLHYDNPNPNNFASSSEKKCICEFLLKLLKHFLCCY